VTGVLPVLVDGVAQFSARGDVELGEHFPEVVLDRARADEQLGADLRVGVPLARESSDLRLLGGEQVTGVGDAWTGGLAGGEQLATGALGERLGAEPAETVMSGSKLAARVRTPVLSTQPFAVHKLGAGEVKRDPSGAKPVERLLVELFGRRAGGEPTGPDTGLHLTRVCPRSSRLEIVTSWGGALT
jgi:hypothetical protein